MLIAFDAGNTNLKFALYDEQGNLSDFRICSYRSFNYGMLEGFSFRHAAISSVVPEATRLLTELLEKNTGIKPYIISHASRFNIGIEYQNPSTLGIDRICSCEGALDLLKITRTEASHILTVDCGTATTVNIVEMDVKADGLYRTDPLKTSARFTGGLICPGINTMFSSLSSNTAQLPLVTLEDYRGSIGNDTRSSIAAGVITATISMIEATVKKMQLKSRSETGREDMVKLFITGGNAAVRQYLTTPCQYAEDLVLRGVKSIYERNSGKQETNG